MKSQAIWMTTLSYGAARRAGGRAPHILGSGQGPKSLGEASSQTEGQSPAPCHHPEEYHGTQQPEPRASPHEAPPSLDLLWASGFRSGCCESCRCLPLEEVEKGQDSRCAERSLHSHVKLQLELTPLFEIDRPKKSK
ncbi:uncharacterized protein LOC108585414 isoform X1 [Papio anubis]|uniref:uncharacterized protein LOC108585414 isoform X1 n=1 Tax=Papio anubis TaxID=9555 RepID=UPI0012AE0A86|nr:uncharacterized protein LOC108585414 isoform X1 [Papio anubis]